MVDTNAQVNTQCGSKMVMVSPIVAGYLARIAAGGDNNDLVTYMNDTVPRSLPANSAVSCDFEIRNEGWNVIPAATTNLVVSFNGCSSCKSFTLALSADIGVAATTTISGKITAPPAAGTYQLEYQLVKLDGSKFKSLSYAVDVQVN